MPDYDWSRLQLMDPGELSLAISRLSRAGVNQKKWMAEVKSKVTEVAESVEKTTRKAGLTRDAIDEIKNKILGISK